ncbi:MAG TPA: serine protease [Patescibacteria group bacterium]|nr:serine protease [Patescibacteria group bacterium]
MTHKWYKGVELITPHIFKIDTPNGSGTGFQISYSKKKNLLGVATAYHVVSQEYEWEQPIKMTHYTSGKNVFLKENRVIIPYPENDLAFILFNKRDIPVKPVLDLPPFGKWVRSGSEIGWCGFPLIYPSKLCFFGGHVSSYLKDRNSYLVDGVGINGVSGGPAFIMSNKSDEVMVCGVISSYLPNRIRGEALPGLCYVSSVEPYLKMLEGFHSLDDAEKKAEEQESQKSEIQPPSLKKKTAKKSTR